MAESNVTNVTVDVKATNSMKDVLETVASGFSVANVSTITSKNGKIISSKEYEFKNPLGKRVSMKTFDSEIIESTEKIGMALHGKKVLDFAIAKEFSRLNTREKLDSMGFKTISEYGKCLFDLSTVTVNQYARIGSIFIGDDYKLKSDILPSNLTKGHLIEMLKYLPEGKELETAETFFTDQILNDGMTTKKMRETLKKWESGENAIEGDFKEIPDNKADTNSGNQSENSDTNTGIQSDISNPNNSGPIEFSKQVAIGQILNKCQEILGAFDALNAHNFTVGGYEKAVAEIRALAESLLDN